MAQKSILLWWAGLVVLAISLKLPASLPNMHRVLVYFSLLTCCVTLYLVSMGLIKLREDLRTAAEATVRVKKLFCHHREIGTI